MATIFQATLLALFLAAATAPVAANDPADIAVALERAERQYRIVMRTMETAGRDQTASEVHLLREAWQQVIAQFDAGRSEPAEPDDDAVSLTQVDAALVGALIVIDIGSRDAARAALTPLGETLAKLRLRTNPR
jgi:Spy/CpxP family protein refolding chaperone